jgi:FtsP/CotA-like multicopper oxidase with cupredoxin domain
MTGSTSSDDTAGEPSVGGTGRLTRGQLLAAGAGVAVAAAAGGVGVSRLLASPRAREVVLRPRPETVELGGRQVATWTYGTGIPGPELRIRQGERLRVRVENGLPEATTVHWHGIRVPNDMDGVPGMTQTPIGPGKTYLYDFVPPDAGTYWFHPHVGTQLDRGLYAPLIVEARNETLAYDREAVVVLDDWLDGLGRTPDAVLRRLEVHGMQMPGMGGMPGMKGMPGMDMGGLGSLTGGNLAALGDGSIVIAGPAVTVAGEDPVSGTLPAFVNLLQSGNADPGDVTYPLFLLNGRPPNDPQSFAVSRGERVRLRLINAAADTHFLFSVDGHSLSLVASDGQSVEPLEVDGVVLGMGERADVVLHASNPGAYRLIGTPLGKHGRAVGVLRYTDAARSMPPPATAPAKEPQRVASYSDLRAPAPARHGRVDRTIRLDLTMDMTRPYRWLLGGQAYASSEPVRLKRGELTRFLVHNKTTMPHPMHLHGHFFTPSAGGPIKDTLVVPPQVGVKLDFVADNPGMWMFHCHNLYHQMAGMMRTVEIT